MGVVLLLLCHTRKSVVPFAFILPRRRSAVSGRGVVPMPDYAGTDGSLQRSYCMPGPSGSNHLIN
ncbi:UNVERIFIED_CONTAM: hypothetical protein Sradi_5100500 [Sesamum radiatum]|uniref:Secreted protein n=1 Tax=Sesamum radiatum TaxID=300843 RepID=A0AAW2M2P1_SESRA